jgi:hypothetical protein
MPSVVQGDSTESSPSELRMAVLAPSGLVSEWSSMGPTYIGIPNLHSIGQPNGDV